MRNYFSLFFVVAFLSACGGGSGSAGGSTGSTIPVGTVSGASFDGLILGGTVSVYDYSTGTQGALLGTATTDGTTGLYSLSLQVESRPVLVVVTGGYYLEEAGLNPASVTLTSNDKLEAVENYTTGSALTVSVTTYSYLAAGLAAYEISKGAAVTTAINDANTRISNLIGVNILTTTPLEVTDVANASASLTPGLRYGFLAGAISEWTLNNAPIGAIPHLKPYSSIDFAQLLYQDISADGLLDGMSIVGGVPAQLSFGTVPLGVDVYRLALGTNIVVMAGDQNNKTGLTGAQVLSFAQSYIASTDPIFNNVAPTAFAAPVVTITSPVTNAWARKTITVTSTASSPFGLQSVAFLVDGVSVATSPTLSISSFTFDTTTLVDGAHTLAVRATDLGGFVMMASVQSQIDNTPPTTTFGIASCTPLPCKLGGIASDAYSGVVGTTITGNVNNSQTIVGVGGVWSLPLPPTYPETVRVRDVAGNCSDYIVNFPMSGNTFYFGLLTAGSCP